VALGITVPNIVIAKALLKIDILVWIESMWFPFVMYGCLFIVVGLLEGHALMKGEEANPYVNVPVKVMDEEFPVVDGNLPIQLLAFVVLGWLVGFIDYLGSGLDSSLFRLIVAASLWIGVGVSLKSCVVVAYIILKSMVHF
jgi:hypothetical protein